MKLLYRTAEWHAVAKLRMQTDATLDHLKSLTKEFGHLMRKFRDTTCSHFRTEELRRELEARKRKREHSKATESSRKQKTLNQFSPKYHFLGDYVQAIRTFGSTDSFSTQVVRQ